MKRKILSILIIILALCTCIITLTACSDNTDPETLGGTEIIAPDFEITNDTLYQKLPNSTATYSFIDNISVAKTSKFTVSTDINGLNTIPTKTVNLNVGDNTFYILVTDKNDNMKLYTVTLRVTSIYNVNFDTLGGSVIPSQSVEENTYVSIPTSEPTKEGYIFKGWNFDFENTKITDDITITVNEWQAIMYTVKYEGNNATSGEMANQTFTYGENQSLNINKFEKTGYSFIGWQLKDTETFFNDGQNFTNYITENNSEIVLVAQWQINKYKATLNKNLVGVGDIITNIVSGNKYDYLHHISISVSTNLGYEYLGLYNGETLLTTDTKYTFNLPANDVEYTVKWKVLEEMSNFYFEFTEDTCEITGIKNKTVTEITIPDFVTAIGYSAFVNCSDLRTVTMGNNVKSIGGWAFQYCSRLENITLPASIVSIGAYSFSHCSSLVEIKIPNQVTSIGVVTFYQCSNLKKITISSNVKSIGEQAFAGCSSLETIIVESGNTTYHSKDNCLIETKYNQLVLGCKNSIIPDYVTSIGNNAFDSCVGLASIYIPEKVRYISEHAFGGCSGLESITVDNNNETYHSQNNCIISTETKTIILGCKNSIIPPDESVTAIGWGAFRGCTELTSITIPNNITKIGGYVFENCNGLQSIIIPNTITKIEAYTFYFCTELQSITFNGTKTQWNTITKGDHWNHATGDYIVHCNDGDISKE